MTGIRVGRWAALTVAVLLAAGCESSSGPEPGELFAQNVARETAPEGAPIAETVSGLTRFGFDLYQAVSAPDQNVVLSPLCVGYAFALARAGAAGETAAQIDQVLGFPGAGVHDALNALTAQLVTTGGPPAPRPSGALGETGPPTVAIANGLFVQEGFEVGEDFLHTLAQKYGAGVRTVDFGTGDEAKRAIDHWVSVQTADRIREVFGQLDPATRVVLANAIYFNADWTHPFPSSADDGTFTRADGTAVQTRMMYLNEALRYSAAGSWQAVELPYAHSDLAMWILVPAPGQSPQLLLSPESLDTVAASLSPTAVRVTLPSWDFESRPDLVGALTRLGLTAPFGAGADFSGIASGLFIGDAMHAATITVDETGTEAAAVAAVAMPVSAPFEPDVEVRADRPFAFAIVHLPTRTPLFIGHVADPSAD